MSNSFQTRWLSANNYYNLKHSKYTNHLNFGLPFNAMSRGVNCFLSVIYCCHCGCGWNDCLSIQIPRHHSILYTITPWLRFRSNITEWIIIIVWHHRLQNSQENWWVTTHIYFLLQEMPSFISPNYNDPLCSLHLMNPQYQISIQWNTCSTRFHSSTPHSSVVGGTTSAEPAVNSKQVTVRKLSK